MPEEDPKEKLREKTGVYKAVLAYGADGSIVCIYETEGKIPRLDSASLDITTDSNKEDVKKHMIEYIVDAGVLRKRTVDELGVAVRKVYEGLKSGDLSRSRKKDDIVDQYPQYLTPDEFDEIEPVEEAIRKLKVRAKTLEEEVAKLKEIK